MVECRKCGKEIKEEDKTREYHMGHRRGKVASGTICSECN